MVFDEARGVAISDWGLVAIADCCESVAKYRPHMGPDLRLRHQPVFLFKHAGLQNWKTYKTMNIKQ